MKRRRLKIGKEEGCSKQERYFHALAAFGLSTAFQKFPAAFGNPYCGDIDPGLYDIARTACLRSRGEGRFEAIIQGGQKNPPQRLALRRGIFYLADFNLADFNPLGINKSNTSGIRLDGVRVPMR